MSDLKYDFNGISHLYSITDDNSEWEVKLDEKISNFVNKDELPFTVVFSNSITNHKVWEYELNPNTWVKFRAYQIDVKVFNKKNEFIFGENYRINKHYDLIEQCLLLNLKKLNLKKGLIAGAGDGTYGEWTSIVKNNLCDLVLIEPDPLSYTKLKDNFNNKDITFINCGVSTQDGQCTFWIAPHGNVSSLIKSNCLSYDIPESDLKEIEIQTYSINNLISKHKVDWIRLDTEGMDCNIINSITNENLTQLKYIQYEHINVTLNDKILTNLFLEKNNFSVFMVGIDMVAIKNELIEK